MDSPSLELVNDRHIYVSGDVVIHPSAAIAPGVLLQADPGSRLTIAAGVCVGQGSVLHAHHGTLVLETGVILGSGVLIVGWGTIGAHACIGSFTTIINASIEAKQSVPPQSLLGEVGRSAEFGQTTSTESHKVSYTESHTVSQTPSTQTASHTAHAQVSHTVSQTVSESGGNAATSDSSLAQKPQHRVYGQAHVEQIMIAMFPHRRRNSPSENSPEPPPE